MYTVLLGSLPPKMYKDFEGAWDCFYLDSRRGCLCKDRGCRCERSKEIKALLDKHGAVQLNAAIIHTDGYSGRRWHVNFKRFIQD